VVGAESACQRSESVLLRLIQGRHFGQLWSLEDKRHDSGGEVRVGLQGKGRDVRDVDRGLDRLAEF
jgi:hypothetical protein